MRETVRTVAAKYAPRDRIRLRDCPDPGTVVEVRCEAGQIQYRADWDRTPSDDRWYDEVRLLDGGDDD